MTGKTKRRKTDAKGGGVSTFKRVVAVSFHRTQPRDPLQLIRSHAISVANDMAAAAWIGDILKPQRTLETINKACAAVQTAAAAKELLGSVWREACRRSVVDKLAEQHSRAQRTLFGKLKNITAVGDIPLEDGHPRLVNLPEEWSRKLSAADLSALAARAEPLDFTGSLDLFRTLARGDDAGLSPLSAAALRVLLDGVRERFGRPVWDDQGSFQFPLDPRFVRHGKAVGLEYRQVVDGLDQDLHAIAAGADPELRQITLTAIRQGLPPYPFSLRMPADAVRRLILPPRQPRSPGNRRRRGDGPAPEPAHEPAHEPASPDDTGQTLLAGCAAAALTSGLERIGNREAAALVPDDATCMPVPEEAADQAPMFPQLAAAVHVTSLTLEISPRAATILAVLSRPCRETQLSQARYIVARDFGYVNTITLTVLRIDRPIEPADLRRLQQMDKEAFRAFLESHAHPGDNVVRTERFCGRDFLRAVAERCRHIDVLRGEIDKLYNRLRRMKVVLQAGLGLPADSLVPETVVPLEETLRRTHVRFFRLLREVRHLKKLRRSEYAAIRGLKDSWFGHLANRETALALEYGAILVRENLTLRALEKDDPAYKGRAFNKMLNNGAKGQHNRRASAKLAWYGVVEVLVPSWYTSTTDFRFSLVDRQQRRGETFTSARTGETFHADEWASRTIGLIPLLQANPGAVHGAGATRSKKVVTNARLLRKLGTAA